MRVIYPLITICMLILSSCEADQKVVDKMAVEVCEVLSKYNEDDSRSVLEAATGLEKLQLQKYSDVSTSQLKSSLENNCPNGVKTYTRLNHKQ